jgi:hypothetical protein
MSVALDGATSFLIGHPNGGRDHSMRIRRLVWIIGIWATGHGSVLLYGIPLVVSGAILVAFVRRSDDRAVAAAARKRIGRVVGFASAFEGIAILAAYRFVPQMQAVDFAFPVVATSSACISSPSRASSPGGRTTHRRVIDHPRRDGIRDSQPRSAHSLCQHWHRAHLLGDLRRRFALRIHVTAARFVRLSARHKTLATLGVDVNEDRCSTPSATPSTGSKPTDGCSSIKLGRTGSSSTRRSQVA